MNSIWRYLRLSIQYTLCMLMIIGTVVAVTAALCIGAFAVIISSMCGDSMIQEVTSPNGKLTAQVIERDCGATTDFARRLQIKRNGWPSFFEPDPALVLEGRAQIEVSWAADSSEITVRYSDGSLIRRVSEQSGVRIVYRDDSIVDQ